MKKSELQKIIREELLNETGANNDAKKFLKGMKKIKVKGLSGWMPGVDYVYKDEKKNQYWFIDTEGDAMELKNIGTLKQLKKQFNESKLLRVNESTANDDIAMKLLAKIKKEEGKFDLYYEIEDAIVGGASKDTIIDILTNYDVDVDYKQYTRKLR